MLSRQFVIILLLLLPLSCSERREVRAPSAVGPTPTEYQLAWHEMETNAFIHFTTNTFTDKEWGFGDESPKIFNPTSFNATQWITALKEAGFTVDLTEIANHDHWYYDKAARFNQTAWEFLKKYELDADPQYRKYNWN